jgi:hypothetical protein
MEPSYHLPTIVALGSLALFSQSAFAQTVFADQAQLITLNRSAGSVTPSDIDNDGDTDLLVFAGGILVYLNDGGTLLPPVIVSDRRLDAVGDLNGDGFPDLIVSERISPVTITRRFYTVLNDGSGTSFSEGVLFAQTTDRMQPPVDVDADGDLDLIQLDTPDTYYWYENTNGAGDFGPRENLISAGTIQFSSGMALGDFNGDGLTDLIAKENTGSGTGTAIRLQKAPVDGVRQFAAPMLLALDGQPVAVGHFNGDANLDVFSILSGNGEAGFLFGNGSGGFTAGPITPDDVYPFSGKVVDWDGDGDLDLLTKGFYEPLELYKQDSGALVGPIELLPGIVDFEDFNLADITGDGRADIGTARENGNFDFAVQNASGDTFAPLQTLLSSLDSLITLDAAQLNDDSRPDIVVGTVSDVISIVRSDGARSFSNFETVATSGSTEFDSVFETGDFDGSNGDDLIQWNSDTGALELLINDGTGAFAAPLPISTQTGGNTAFEVADFNGDTHLDFAVVSLTPSRVIVYLQSAVTPLTFTPTTVAGTMSAPDCLHAADLDLDGDLDLLVGGYNGSDGEVGLLVNPGSGAFPATVPLFTHTGTVSRIRSANLNPGIDSDIDLIVLENDGTHSSATVYGNSSGVFTAGQEIFSRSASGWTFEMGDLDQDGDPDIALTGSAGAGDVRVEWFENDGSGLFGTAASISTDTTAKRSEIVFADIDDDGDLDIVTGDLNTGRVEWFENQLGEGPLERWAKPRGATNFDPLSDEDQDGHSLTEEYAFNLNPLTPQTEVVDASGASGLPYIRLFQSGNRTRVDYRVIRRSDADNGLVYQFQTSTDLISWTDLNITGGSTTSDPNYRRVTTNGLQIQNPQTPAHFGRVKVTYTEP